MKGAGTKERPLWCRETKAGFPITDPPLRLRNHRAMQWEARWAGVVELVRYDQSKPLGFHAARARLLTVLARRR